MKKQQPLKPFFSIFLEGQLNKDAERQLQGGEDPPAQTNKYPSDQEDDISKKYPSDLEDDYTKKYPTDSDEVTMAYPSDSDHDAPGATS